jgi:hypothetical protein
MFDEIRCDAALPDDACEAGIPDEVIARPVHVPLLDYGVGAIHRFRW